MEVYAKKTSKTTSTGKAVYHVIDAFEASQAYVEPNFKLAYVGDLSWDDESTILTLRRYQDYLIVNESGLVDVDRAASIADRGF